MRPVLLLAPLLLAACTSHSTASPTTTATPTAVDPCLAASPPPGCITSTPGASHFPYPADAGRISPLPVPEKFAGELARKDNNLSPGIHTATITVTVAAGKVLATDLLCQGRGKVAVTSRPASAAQQAITCDGNQIPSQRGARASSPVKVATRYVVTLRASGPSRWLVAVSARAPQ